MAKRIDGLGPLTGTRHDDNVPGYGEVTCSGTACLLCGEHRGVRIGAVREQQDSHVDPSGVDRLEQRAARRERLVFGLVQLHPLVRVETRFEQSTQHVRTIAPGVRIICAA